MSDLVTFSKEGDVGVIEVNNPPVNALSPGVPEGIREGLKKASDDPSIKAVVLMGKGPFIAGADIREFEKAHQGRAPGRDAAGLNPFLNSIEESAKPVVAAIAGFAFGGGLETAMACHYRVAEPNARVGQPEVNLGIIPGAGGTVRLPRLVGVAKAAEMCAAGAPVKAKDALALGILDKIIEGDLRAGAIAFAREAAGKGAPRKTRDLTDKLGDAASNKAALDALRKDVGKKNRGKVANLRAIDAVEAAATMPFDQAIENERKIFAELVVSDQCKALVHAFFAERAVTKIPDVPKDTPTIDIKQAAIIGAGTMGGGIAMVYVNAGIPVILKEVKQEYLDKGMEKIKQNYDISVQRGRFTPEFVEQRMKMITPTLDYAVINTADVVVEAAFEEMKLKKEIFAELDKHAKQGAILASNTSTLDIDEIASSTKRPEFVVGHHFFAPPNVMKLLEVVRGKATNKSVLATSMKLSKKLEKVGVLVGNCHGFVGNRMYHHYQREAQFLVEEGAKPQQIDMALYNWGMAMGPLAVGDLSGLDISWRIRKEIAHTIPAGKRLPQISYQLAEMGRFGQKTGKGWYSYEGRNPMPDPEVEKMIADYAEANKIPQRQISDQEIVEKTIFALVNEGAVILEEGIALRAGDIDIVYLYGYGFPPHRGGPMFYADTVGLKYVVSKIKEYQKDRADDWKLSPLLEKLAAEGKTFQQFDAERSGD